MTHPTATDAPVLDPAETQRLVDSAVTLVKDTDFQNRVQAIVDDLGLPENYRIIFERDKKNPDGRFYLQIACQRPDTFTGVMGEGRGGKKELSEYMSKSEIVFAVWGLYENYVIHEARETFLYRGRRVLGPHIDVDALWEVAERTDARQHLDLNPAAQQPDPAAANVPDDVRRLIDDQERYEASARERAESVRAATAGNPYAGGTAPRLDEQADTHRKIAFILGTLPLGDAEVEIRARLAEKHEDKAAADASGDEDRFRQEAVLGDIWVCALNEVTDVQHRRREARA